MESFKYNFNGIHSDSKILLPSGQKFSLLADPKIPNFVELNLGIVLFIVNFTKFIFAIDRFEKVAV